jgi:hypothetical protein
MNTFLILWVIAGAIIGWVGIDVIAVAFKARVPYLFNIGMAFVGALVAYTLLK